MIIQSGLTRCRVGPRGRGGAREHRSDRDDAGRPLPRRAARPADLPRRPARPRARAVCSRARSRRCPAAVLTSNLVLGEPEHQSAGDPREPAGDRAVERGAGGRDDGGGGLRGAGAGHGPAGGVGAGRGARADGRGGGGRSGEASPPANSDDAPRGESDQRRDGAGPVRGGDGGRGRRGVGGTVHDRGQLRGLLRGRHRRGPARQRPGRPGPPSARRSAAGGHAQRADAVPRLPARRARARQRGGGGGRRRSRAHPRVAAHHPRPVPGSGLRVLGPGHLHDQRRSVRTGRPAVPPGRGGSGREDPPRGAGGRGRHHGGRHRYPTGVGADHPLRHPRDRPPGGAAHAARGMASADGQRMVRLPGRGVAGHRARRTGDRGRRCAVPRPRPDRVRRGRGHPADHPRAGHRRCPSWCAGLSCPRTPGAPRSW